jgi:hypothetical protein
MPPMADDRNRPPPDKRDRGRWFDRGLDGCRTYRGSCRGAFSDADRPAAGSSSCCVDRRSRYGLLVRRATFGASSFSFSRASGIMRPNMELSMAVGMRPPLFSVPCPPDIRNCGTSG